VSNPFESSSDGPATSDRPAFGPVDAQAVIDQVLDLLLAEWRRVAAHLAPEIAAPFGLTQLRDGPAGRDLRRLAAVARGELIAEPEHVDQAIDSILQLLYWPAGAHAYAVPDGFWQTALGGMLVEARDRARRDVGRSPGTGFGIDRGAPAPSPELTPPIRSASEAPNAGTS
jgi:hypothetical protein